MKLYKKEIGKLFLTTWKDAWAESGITLRDALKKGFEVNHTIGWLRYFDNDKIIISHEYSDHCEVEDFSFIPRDWIIEMEER